MWAILSIVPFVPFVYVLTGKVDPLPSVGGREPLMRKVVIRCPSAGQPAWTGIAMSELMFDAVSELAVYTFRCPLCGKLHSWSKGMAWLEGP